MNRSDFFKKLGLGALAVVVAPKMFAEGKEEPKLIIQSSPQGKFQWTEYDYLPSPEDILKEYRRTGNLYYDSEAYYKAQMEADFKLSKYINNEIRAIGRHK